MTGKTNMNSKYPSKGIFLLFLIGFMNAYLVQGAHVSKMKACQNLYVSDKALCINSVTFTDTLTAVSFTYSGTPGLWVRFASTAYASDEAGRRHRVVRAQGIDLDSLSWIPESGKLSFSICFEPLPKATRVFDIVEGTFDGAFRIYGIHDRRSKLRIPKAEESIDSMELDARYFHPDTTVLRGRIQSYNRNGMPDMVKVCYSSDRISFTDGEHYPNCAKIELDGTFCCSFLMDSPKWSELQFGAQRTLPIYVRPGDTLEIQVEKYGQWNERVSYQETSGRPSYERLMEYDTNSFWNDMMNVSKSITRQQFRKALEMLNARAELFHDYLAWKFSLSPWETHLLKKYWQLSTLRLEMDYMERKKSGIDTLKHLGLAWDDATILLTPTWSAEFRDRLTSHGFQVPLKYGDLEKVEYPAFSRYSVNSPKAQSLIDSFIRKTGTNYIALAFLNPQQTKQSERFLVTLEHLTLDFENSRDVSFLAVICCPSKSQLPANIKWRLERHQVKYVVIGTEEFLDLRAAFRKTEVPFEVMLANNGSVLRQPFYMHDEIMFRNNLRTLLRHESSNP